MILLKLVGKRERSGVKKREKEAGFTLVEVLITILLFTVVLTAILSCFIQGFDILMRMKQLTIATQSIQKELELIRNMHYNDILTMDSSFTNDSFSYLENSSGIINLEDSVGAEIKKLTVSVAWMYRGRQMRKEVVTYVTKKGINKK
ncbi:MAG: type II secretion system GspH family protein [Candidatus Aminicenantes bacterium]|nr:type II secretion system GspH family protein [Candidatus Aminicenantes bacterium]MDH5707060.1 type II secretion system GspH family protein [Candidatus Aminicenantes bacterium]